MKVGIVGTGAVGAATALALVERGVCRDIVLIDRDSALAVGVASDLRYASALSRAVDVWAGGGYHDLAGAALVILTAGVNQRVEGATDRADPRDRLRLAAANARIFTDVVPAVVDAAPQAVLMVVTDPPELLAEIARRLAGHSRVFSTGTLIDSLRFQVHLAERLGVHPGDVNAMVIGEHGSSEVLLWSSATVAGRPALDLLNQQGTPFHEVRCSVENEMRYANIAIIEGTGASRYGIAAVTARLAEAVLRDERAVLSVGAHHPGYRTTVSLPCVVGAHGVQRVIEPSMTSAEGEAMHNSAQILREATTRCEKELSTAANAGPLWSSANSNGSTK